MRTNKNNSTVMLPDRTLVERIVWNVKTITPSRFGSEAYPDMTGFIRLYGMRVKVQTAYLQEVMIWEVVNNQVPEGNQS